MLGELIRVRIDAAHLPESTDRSHADLALPTNIAVAALLPDLLQIFNIDIADFPLVTWQLRTATGQILRADDTLVDAGITHGDRLVVINDPGPIPGPRIFDAADAIADTTYTDGIGTADVIVGCTAALIATVSVAAASLSLGSTDITLGAAVSFVALLVVAGCLRIGLVRNVRAAIICTLEIQVLVLVVSFALSFVGLELSRILAAWPPTAALAAGFAVTGLVFLLVDGNTRITCTIGAASLGLSIPCGIYSATIAALQQPSHAGAVSAASALILLLMAPSLAIKAAGIRVPKIPAAGESFDDSATPTTPAHAPRRAGWLLDGIIVAGAATLTTFTLVALLSDSGDNRRWLLAMAAAIIIFSAVHSRGQARKVTSTANALTALSVAVTVAMQQWFAGNWPIAAAIVVPMLAGTALSALPATRISPTTRRFAELTEACAIAVILPIAAIIAGLPELVGGLFQ